MKSRSTLLVAILSITVLSACGKSVKLGQLPGSAGQGPGNTQADSREGAPKPAAPPAVGATSTAGIDPVVGAGKGASPGKSPATSPGPSPSPMASPNTTPTSPPPGSSGGGGVVFSDPSHPVDPRGAGPGPIKGSGGATQSCQPARWEIRQSARHEQRPSDLLFVVDTSPSLARERAQLASLLPRFLQSIPANADLNIAVLPAHGGASPWSGRLFAPAGSPRVLSLRALGPARTQELLHEALLNAPKDRDEANGEMLLYSLDRALKSDRVAEARAMGFFRDHAALSVIFVTDENDGCVLPYQMGYTKEPDYVPSRQHLEEKAWSRYCAGITPQNVVAQIRSTLPRNPLSLGAVVHWVAAGIPSSTTGSEDSIGHGIIETVWLTPNRTFLEMKRPDTWAAGLGSLGSIVSTQLELHTDIILAQADTVFPQSLKVSVDGRPVAFAWSRSAKMISIAAQDAGRIGSLIAIDGCK